MPGSRENISERDVSPTVNHIESPLKVLLGQTIGDSFVIARMAGAASMVNASSPTGYQITIWLSV
jgi:hypothetical protein